MRILVKLKVILIVFTIFLTSKSVAADLILPLPKPSIDAETKIQRPSNTTNAVP